MNKDQQLPHDLLQHLRLLDVLDRITQVSLASNNIEDVMRGVLYLILDVFNADRAWFLYPCDPDAQHWNVPLECTRPEWPGLFAQGVDIPMDSGTSEIFSELLRINGTIQYGPDTDHPLPPLVAEHFSVKSQLMIALRPKIGNTWVFGLHHCESEVMHDKDDLHLFTSISHRISDTLSVFISTRQLRESEVKFRSLYDSTSEAVMLLGENGFIDCNRATLLIFGCASLEEFCSKHPADFSPPEQPCGTDSMMLANLRIATAMEKGSHFFEWMHKRADTDKNFPAEVLLSAMELDGKKVIQATVRDITERKKVEETIRASEARLQEIINVMPVVLFIKDPASNIMLMNRACEEQWGMSFSDLRGTDASQFFPPEQMAIFLAKDREVFANRQLVDFEETAWNATLRENRIVRTYKKPVFDAACKPLYLIGMSIDITERKAIEKELLESKTQLQATLDAVPDLLFEVGLDGQIYDYHSPRTELLAVPPDVFLGKKFSDVLPPTVAEVCMSALRDAHKNGVSTGKQYELPLPQGKFWFELSVSRKHVNPGQEPRFICLARDITERNTAERQLRNLSAHMLSVREEEKASIAREIHDELGGTLTALKMQAYWLSRKLPANEETTLLLERVELMSQLIDHAVGATRRIITDLRPTMLDDLGLLAALEWQCTQFHKRTGIECLIRCVEDEGDLDKQRSIALFRIFQEALTNVARHSGASRVEVNFHHDEEKVVLSISDNGRGLPKERAIAAGSYGILGMTERVEQLGGKIKLDSLPGGGLGLTVTLPLSAGESSV